MEGLREVANKLKAWKCHKLNGCAESGLPMILRPAVARFPVAGPQQKKRRNAGGLSDKGATRIGSPKSYGTIVVALVVVVTSGVSISNRSPAAVFL